MFVESVSQLGFAEAAPSISTLRLIEVADIRADLLAESARIFDSALAASVPQAKPTLVHLCGIPGAGKTTYARAWHQVNPGFALVQFDSIMESLQGYRADHANLGLVAAFANWELPARVIGYHLLQALVSAKRNVLFDHSAAALTHLPLLERVKEAGYVIEMHHVQCATAEALSRIQRRELVDMRHTPPALVHERFDLLNDLVPQYKKIVDRFVSVSGSD